MASQALTNIHNRLKSAPKFKPATMSGFTDWASEAGDVISVLNDGDRYTMPIFGSSMTWMGAPYTTIESTGDESRDELTDVTSSSRYSSGRADDQGDEIQELEGSYAFQNAEQIGAVIGKYTYDPVTGKVSLVDGAIDFLRQNPDGTYTSVSIVGSIDSLKGDYKTITGSGIWQNRDEILSAVGTIKEVNGRVTEIEGSYVKQTSDEWTALVGLKNTWSSISVTPSAINSVVSGLNGKTVVTQESNLWSVVSKNASNGQDAYTKWANLTVTQEQIQSVVGGLNGKTVVTQDDKNWIVQTVKEDSTISSFLSIDRDKITAMVGAAKFDEKTGKMIGILDGTYVTQSDSRWQVIAAKTKEQVTAILSIDASSISQIVTSLKGKTVVTTESDAWSVVSANAEAGKDASDKWASITVNANEINNTVSNLKGKRALRVKQTSKKWQIIAYDPTAASPTDMVLMTVGAVDSLDETMGVDLGDYATVNYLNANYVKASTIEAKMAYVESLMTKKANSSILWANTIRVTSLEVAGSSFRMSVGADGETTVSTDSQSVLTGHRSLSTSGKILTIPGGLGFKIDGQAVTSNTNVTVLTSASMSGGSSTTLKYLKHT